MSRPLRRTPRAGISLLRAAGPLALLVTASSCLESPSYEGRACDRFSPCPEELVCGERLICERPGPSKKPDASVTTPEAGGGDAGAEEDAFGDSAAFDARGQGSEAGDRDAGDGDGVADGGGATPEDGGGALDDASGGVTDGGMAMDLGVLPSDASGPTDAVTALDAGCAIRVNGQGEYCTIQEAVNAAPAGGTVSVPAGSFTGGVVLSKALVLTGLGTGSAGGTLVVGAPGAPAAIEVQASNVEVTNLRIEGPAGGVAVSGAGTGVALHDLAVADVTGFGISTSEAAIVITGVSIERVLVGSGTGREGHGVSASQGAVVELRASQIRGCAGDGVHVEAATVNVHAATNASDSLIEDNNGYGIYSAGSLSSLYVKPNPSGGSNFGNITIRRNDRSAVYAAGGYARVADNTIEGDSGTSAPQHGISFNGTGDYYAKRNTVSGASGFGLYCDPAGSSVNCDSGDPNTLAGNALGPRSPGCAAICGQ